MGEELRGRTVAILQTRNREVMARLVARRGGRPLLAPVLLETEVEDSGPVEAAVRRAASGPLDWAVFQTGVGAHRVFELADRWGLGEQLSGRLAGAVVVARGPKPLAALLKRGVEVQRRTAEPHTTAELLGVIEPRLPGAVALVQHHGAPNPALVEALADRGATLLHAVTYRWALPADTGPALRYLAELSGHRVDATVFTSASQVGNLFEIAERAGCAPDLPGWLRERTAIASIGPATSAALAEHDLAAAVTPAHPKMAPLVDALCAHRWPGRG